MAGKTIRKMRFGTRFAIMNNLRGQSSTELIMLAAASFLALLLVYILALDQFGGISGYMRASSLLTNLNRLAKAADNVYTEGLGARTSVAFNLPVNLNYTFVGYEPLAQVNTKVIYANYWDGISPHDLYATSAAYLNGTLPNSTGFHRVWVTAIPGGAYLGNLTYEVDDNSISFILAPGETGTANLRVTSLTNSSVNTNYNVVVSMPGDPEVEADPDSFSLDPEKSQNVTITADAEEESFGIYSGSLIIRETTSGINTTIPITVEVG